MRTARHVAWTWETQELRESRNWMILTTKGSGDKSVIEVSEMPEIAVCAVMLLRAEWNDPAVENDFFLNAVYSATMWIYMF